MTISSRSTRIAAKAKPHGKNNEVGDELQHALVAESTGQRVFHLFPKLPIEIRLKIWRLNALEPRVVRQLNRYSEKLTVVANPTPSVLHVCRESRNEFLCRNNDPVIVNPERPLYRPLFEDSQGKRIFFSFELDALHLTFFRVAEPLIKKELRHLIVGNEMIAINTKLSDFMSSTPVTALRHGLNGLNLWHYYWGFNNLNSFQKLETLVVLVPPDDALSTKQRAESKLDDLKKRYPDWKAPKLIIKDVKLGGHM